MGTVVDVKEISNGWGRIQYNGRDGWVCMEYLKLVSAQTYQVTDPDGLNVRTGPGTGHGVITAIGRGTKVDVTEIRGNWGKIVYDGREGWICLDYAKPVGSAPAPAPVKKTTPAPVPAKSTSSFSASNEILHFIEVSEGYEEHVAEDDLVSGTYQIGYGHVIYSKEELKQLARDGFVTIAENGIVTMTREQAHNLLVRDLNGYYGKGINLFLQGNHIIANQQQFDALLSFTYNLGVG